MGRDNQGKLVDLIGGFIGEESCIFIGLGNEFRGDDAAGLMVARKLAAQGIAALEGGRSLLEALYSQDCSTFNRLLLIDAANLGLPPGHLLVLRQDEITEKGLSTHENNLDLALNFFRSENPDGEVLFLGIQFASMEMTEGLTLTPEMEKGVDQAVDLVTRSLRR